MGCKNSNLFSAAKCKNLDLFGAAKSVKNLNLFGNCFHKGNTNLLNVCKSIKILIYVNKVGKYRDK